MNSKLLILASLVGIGAFSLAEAADQYVYLTGSTAGRAAAYATLADGSGTSIFDGPPTIVVQGTGAAAPTDDSTATLMNFTGHIIGDAAGIITTIACRWSGSEGGIADLNTTTGTQLFLSDTATTPAVKTTTPGPTAPHVVDLAAADNAVQFSKNPSAPVNGAFVAVIPFKFVKQKGSSANLTNVTDQAFRQALRVNAKLALFSGDALDTTKVYVSGRDNNSGTRVNAFGVTGYGIFAAPKHVKINADGSMAGTGTYSGDTSTYNQGGAALAAQMGYDLNVSTSLDKTPGGANARFSVISYLGIPDATDGIAVGGTELTYNGVPYSVDNVKQGKYNFWGNYHIYQRNAPINANASLVYSKLTAATGIDAHADDVVLIKSSTMSSTRGGPTSDIIHN